MKSESPDQLWVSSTVLKRRVRRLYFNGSSHNWIKSNRPKVSICPHKEDYCDTYCKHKNQIHGKQTTINRLRQSSNADPEDIKHLEGELSSLKWTHENHCQEAQKAHQYYIEVTSRCATELKLIQELSG